MHACTQVCVSDISKAMSNIGSIIPRTKGRKSAGNHVLSISSESYFCPGPSLALPLPKWSDQEVGVVYFKQLNY